MPYYKHQFFAYFFFNCFKLFIFITQSCKSNMNHNFNTIIIIIITKYYINNVYSINVYIMKQCNNITVCIIEVYIIIKKYNILSIAIILLVTIKSETINAESYTSTALPDIFLRLIPLRVIFQHNRFFENNSITHFIS